MSQNCHMILETTDSTRTPDEARTQPTRVPPDEYFGKGSWNTIDIQVEHNPY